MNEVGRWLFAAALALSWANSALHVLWSDRPFYLMSARVFEGRVRAARAAVLGAGTLVYLPLVVAFTAGPHPEAAALALLVAMALIRRWEVAEWPDDIVIRLGKYVPAGAAMAAWLAAQPILRALGHAPDAARHLGWNAACGVVAGMYLLAGIAKLREAGLVWAEPGYQALLVAERAFYGPRVLRDFRLAVARSPRASRVVGVVGLALEVAAVGFVVPDLRFALAAAIVTLHAGFVVLLGYVEPEWTAVVVAVALLAA